MRRAITTAALAALIAACGGVAADTTTTQGSAASSTAGSAATSTPDPTTVEPAVSTTTAEVTSTSMISTSSSLGTTAGSGTLDDGRPATFVAVTDDYEAVEVDTITGDVLRSFGQTGTSADFSSEGELGPNALDAVWRSSDRSVTFISDCCEPAAGIIYLLTADDQIRAGSQEDLDFVFGWSLSPAPIGGNFVTLNEAISVMDPDRLDSPIHWTWIFDTFGTWAAGTPTWNPAGDAVTWLGVDDAGVTYVHSVSLVSEEPEELATALDWVGAGRQVDGLTTRADGNLVAFLSTVGESGTIDVTEGVVIDPGGALLARFPVEVGSMLGGYDLSGQYLIYVDGQSTVRWQGAGQSGSLGDGYIFASW
jgi:hypothetical protein